MEGSEALLSIDLGSGRRPRGDWGITLPGEGALVDVTSGIDTELASWSWEVKPTGRALEGDLEDEDTWALIDSLIGEAEAVPRYLLSHCLEHVHEPWALLTHIGETHPSDVTVVVPNASVSRADWADPEHRYSWTGGSLMNLLRSFGEVTRTGWFGPVMDLAVQYRPHGSKPY